MTNPHIALALDLLVIGLCAIFLWSTFIVLFGLLVQTRRHPKASRRLRFAVVICARNEERVIRQCVKSIAMSKYPAEFRQTFVLADNCTDSTAERARAAGATVWEKSTPSHGKGDVLAWGIERIRSSGNFDAIAVFDADNIASDTWFDAMNDALQDGEEIATGRRLSVNSRASILSGWYTVYWSMMNELSNRVRTNLSLSGKLTGTGFAFLISALGDEGWSTKTMVEDVEFTVQSNIIGKRVAYVPLAEYADEQPETLHNSWRQLRRWTTGGWQVARLYSIVWLRALARKPSLRLFDCYFAILTGMSVAFVLLFNIIALCVKCAIWGLDGSGIKTFASILFAVVATGVITSVAAVSLSPERRRPSLGAIFTFPVFSMILSAAVIASLFKPVRRWKPIPHIGTEE